MNADVYAMDNKISGKEINQSIAIWNGMNGEEKWKYIVNVPKSLSRSCRLMTVHIALQMRAQGII